MKNLNKKILIADDDFAIVDSIKMILEDEGYYVDSTANGETVPKTGALIPDLLLLDICMVNVDGREICRELKSRNITKKIPIILISANRDAALTAYDAGADAFLAKPFELQDLLNMVKKYLK